jgi:site-specific recombinase XerD
LNARAKYLIDNCPLLFVKKYKDQYMNRDIKTIFQLLKIKKHVSFHVGRHTFATIFINAGGQAEYLQKILGHTTIRQTMEYVYLLQQDANKQIHLLDDFLK